MSRQPPPGGLTIGDSTGQLPTWWPCIAGTTSSSPHSTTQLTRTPRARLVGALSTLFAQRGPDDIRPEASVIPERQWSTCSLRRARRRSGLLRPEPAFGTGVRGRKTADLEAMPSTPPERIEDPPIVLWRYRGGELQALFEAVATSADHLSPWLAWASVEPLEQRLGDFISHSVEAFGRRDNYNYAIWNLAETTLVGGAGLHLRLGPGRIEIGYWVRAGWLRRGIASAAARALTTAAFQLTGMEEVHIHCDEANVASAGVPRGLGFRLRRTIDDEVSACAEVGRSMEWAITLSEWNSLH